MLLNTQKKLHEVGGILPPFIDEETEEEVKESSHSHIVNKQWSQASSTEAKEHTSKILQTIQNHCIRRWFKDHQFVSKVFTDS